MKYNVPELQLTGTATNLVLQESGQPKDAGPTSDCDNPVDEIPSIEWGLSENW